MSYRLEDNGITLRLFKTEGEALAHPNAHSPLQYGGGWVARNDTGRWVDADGVLPPAWSPRAELIVGPGRRVEYRGWLITVTHTPEYGTHPFEWHIEKAGESHDDPTSWQRAEDAVAAGKQAVDYLADHGQ